MLLRQHACGQRRLVVVGAHRHRGLDHDRSIVELGGHEVHRRAMQLHPGLERAPVRMQPRKRRQQRGMDVEQPALVAAHEALGEHAHETREHDQIRRMGVDAFGQRGVEAGAVGVRGVIDHRGGNPVRTREG